MFAHFISKIGFISIKIHKKERKFVIYLQYIVLVDKND